MINQKCVLTTSFLLAYSSICIGSVIKLTNRSMELGEFWAIKSRSGMIILYLIAAYFISGIIFSIPFLWKWIDRVDEASHGTNWSFKLAISPGCVVLWPSLFKKYLDTRK